MENIGKIERKTLFLYPYTDKIKAREEKLKVMDLIADVSKIALKSNDEIKKLLMSGCFAFIRCRPSVSLKCVQNYLDGEYDCNDVRICITGYCNQDYSTYYGKVVDDYQSGTSDISHLVAIRIVEGVECVRFLNDPEKKFSAVVETSLNHLDLVLESIMMDIALYHYFRLDNTLKERRLFNAVKSEYICKQFDEESKKLYSLIDDSQYEMYLPFSFPHIKRYNDNSKSLKDEISSLIQEFGYFAIKHNSTCLWYNSNSALRSEKASRDADRIQKIISNNSAALDFIHSKTSFILLLFGQDSAKNSGSLVLKWSENILLSGWLEAISNDIKASFFLLCPDKEAC